MHVVLEFQAGVVQVGELVLLSNTGDKTFVAQTKNGPTLHFSLPAGYTDLTFQDGQLGASYQQVSDGFVDTLPLIPGSGVRQILLSFKLPYPGALTFSQLLQYPVAEVDLLLPEAGVSLRGANNFVDAGLQDLQNTRLQLYTTAGLKAGDPLNFELSGQPSTSEGTTAAPAFDLRGALIGGSALALAILLVGYWWIQHRPLPAPTTVGGRGSRAAANNFSAQREELLDKIAELDEAFEVNVGAPADYQAKREKLKAELKRIMAKEPNA